MTYVHEGRRSTVRSIAKGDRRARTFAKRLAPHLVKDLAPGEEVLGALLLSVGSTFRWQIGGTVAGFAGVNIGAAAGLWDGGWLMAVLVALIGAVAGLWIGWLNTRDAPVRSPVGIVSLVVTDRRVLFYNDVRGVRRGPVMDHPLSDVADVRFRRGKWFQSSTIRFTVGDHLHWYESPTNLDYSSLMQVLAGGAVDRATDDHSDS